MTDVYGVKIPMTPWVVLPLVLLVLVAVTYGLSVAALWLVRKLVGRKAEDFDSRFYRLLEHYLFPILLLVSFFVLEDVVPLPPKTLRALHHVVIAVVLLLATLLLTKVALLILRSAAGRYEQLRNISGPIEIVTKLVLIAVGGMIILGNLGISITPILTTLGIGSLAVAIALQDTLGNFFAGLYIKADRPIEVGHYVRLESGEEGYVEHIGWRSTRIRMLPNNMVIVPNSKMVQSILVNYYLPDRELAVLVQVGVHYDSDLSHVERVTCEVAREVLASVPGGVSGFEPFIRYHTFSDSSIDFTVILRGREFTDNFLIKHEFIKRLQARYRQEGITIPFPIRTVYLDGGDAGARRVHDAAEAAGRPS